MSRVGQCPKWTNQPRASGRAFRIPGIGLINSYHPDFNDLRAWQWARGGYDSFARNGRHSMILSRTDEGYSGVLTTHLNSCAGFATMAGCTKTDRCYRYHMPLGYIASNLPGRNPVQLGEVVSSVGVLFQDLIKFDSEADSIIQSSNRNFMKKLRRKGNDAMEAKEEKDRLDVERAALESMIAGTRKRVHTQIDLQAPAATLPHKVARGLRYVPPPSIIEIKAKEPKFLVTKRKVNGVMVVKVINRKNAAAVLQRWSDEAEADEAIEAAAKAKGIEAAEAKGIEAAEAKGIEAADDEDMGGEDFDDEYDCWHSQAHSQARLHSD